MGSGGAFSREVSSQGAMCRGDVAPDSPAPVGPNWAGTGGSGEHWCPSRSDWQQLWSFTCSGEALALSRGQRRANKAFTQNGAEVSWETGARSREASEPSFSALTP